MESRDSASFLERFQSRKNYFVKLCLLKGFLYLTLHILYHDPYRMQLLVFLCYKNLSMNSGLGYR
jgi:hypothetical protein